MASGKKIVQCERCGFKFDISYSRMFVCGECPAILQCGMVKCPNCGYEFEVTRRGQGLAEGYDLYTSRRI